MVKESNLNFFFFWGQRGKGLDSNPWMREYCWQPTTKATSPYELRYCLAVLKTCFHIPMFDNYILV